jgi:hypothetical protein
MRDFAARMHGDERVDGILVCGTIDMRARAAPRSVWIGLPLRELTLDRRTGYRRVGLKPAEAGPPAGESGREISRLLLPPNGVRFFVCTRDRPQTLGLSIESLSRAFRQAFPGVFARCYILDDSTTPALSAQVRSVASSTFPRELQLTVIDRARQRAIHQRLAGLVPESSRFLRSTCRRLGEGPWDLAGVRNFAYLLAYSYSADDDIVVFLDDDILLTSSVYGGHFITIDGESLIRKLVSSTPVRQLVASGAAYFGRFDGSILDHLRLFLDDVRRISTLDMRDLGSRRQARGRLQQLSLFPSTLPVQLALPGTGTFNDGPGISGALLATTPASLVSHCLPSCYNEDWIWLALLGRPGAAIRCLDSRALHAAPPQPAISDGPVAYQITGEVVYRAVRDVLKDARSCSNGLDWCAESVSVGHLLSAKQSVMREVRQLLNSGAVIDELLDACLSAGEDRLRASVGRAGAEMRRSIEHALVRAEALDHTALHRWFRRYLSRVPMWRELLRHAREILSEREEGAGRPRSAEALDEHQV